MTRKQRLSGILLLIFLSVVLCGSVTAALQPVIFFNPDVVESNTGDNDTVLVMMDGAVKGLSGYGMIISIDQPDIAEFTSVTLPVWVGLKDVKQINSTTYLVQGTDISDMQNPGALQIVIADLKIHAKAPGYATITVAPIAFDDDQRGRYTPSVVSGSIVITGAGPEPIIPMNS